MLHALDANGIPLGFATIPWSWVILAVVVVLGLLLIRTAITLVKVAIVVAIGIALWWLVEYVLHNFG